MINDKTEKLIKKEELYEGGANCPTLCYTYAYACGKGRVCIVEYPILTMLGRRLNVKRAQRNTRCARVAGITGN